MKEKIFPICKKVLATSMTLAILAQTSVALGTTAFAEESSKSGDGTIAYKSCYKDDNTGITYYDIYDGSSEGRSKVEKEIAKKAVTYKDGLKNWAKVAYDVISSEEEAYSVYDGCSFDEAWGNSDDVECFNMVNELSNTSSGVIKNDRNFRRSGLQVGYSLTDARDAMYNMPVASKDEGDISASNIQKYSDVPLLDDSSDRLVLYDFVSTLEKFGVIQKHHYNVFGLVFYDFEFCPICDDDGIYTTTAVQEMLQDTSKKVASCDGFSYATNTSDGINVTTLVNDAKTEAEMEVGDEITHSQVLSNTISETTDITYGQAIEGSVGVTIKDFVKVGVDVGFTFEEMYETGYSNTEQNGKEVTDTHKVSFGVPAYSTVSVGKNTSTTTIVIDYDQAVAIKYKTAVVSIRGGFFADGCSVDVKSYEQGQFATVFGAVDNNNKSNGTTNDSITSLKNRYETNKEDGNNNAEKKSYTLLTKNKGTGSVKTLSQVLNWDSIKKQKYSISDVINTLDTSNHTMSAVGAEMTGKESVYEYFASDAVVTNPLKNIKVYRDSLIKKAVTEEDLAVGDDLSFAQYSYKAYFSDGVTEYPDFDAAKGSWILTDEDGNEIKESSVAEIVIDGGKNQRLKAKSTGTVYVKYLITEDKNKGYYYYDSTSASAKQIKNSDLDSVPFIKVTIHDSRTGAAVASMFNADNTGTTVTVIVGVIIIAGAVFVIIKKRKNIKKN